MNIISIVLGILTPLICIILACLLATEYSKRIESERRAEAYRDFLQSSSSALALYLTNDRDHVDHINKGEVIEKVRKSVRTCLEVDKGLAGYLRTIIIADNNRMEALKRARRPAY